MATSRRVRARWRAAEARAKSIASSPHFRSRSSARLRARWARSTSISSAFSAVSARMITFSGPSPEWQSLVQRLPLSTAQRRILLAHPEGFANEDYRKLNKVDRDEAYRAIQELVSMGVVLPPSASGRGAIYRLSPELHQARVWLEGRVPQLRQHFKTHESVTNAEYRKIFGVTRYTAVRELRRLVEERFLSPVGERRGARYISGPVLATKGKK